VVADSPLAPHASTPAELQARLSAEREGDPFLVYRDDQGRQRLEPLESRAGRVTIGRNPTNDVALTWDEEVSRLHAEIECLGGEWIIGDEGLSRNGSFVNGERVDRRRRLRDGDVIRIGRTTLAFRVPAPADSSPTAAAAQAGGTPQVTDTQRRILTALVRPYRDADFAAPATNGQIAEEVFLSVDAVKAHLRGLFQAFGVDALPQNQKRAALAMRALQEGVVNRRDL